MTGIGAERRKGDVFFIQEFIAILILLFIGVLIFGLFWFQAQRFAAKVSSSDELRESYASERGGTVLRTYLSTRMDLPTERFLPSGSQLYVSPHPLTFGEAIPLLFEDRACVVALAANGASYEAMARMEEGYDLFAATELPDGLCRDFFLRTVLFHRVLTRSDSFRVEASDGTRRFAIGLAPEQARDWTVLLVGTTPLPLPFTIAPDLDGRQTLPGPFETRLIVRGDLA